MAGGEIGCDADSKSGIGKITGFALRTYYVSEKWLERIAAHASAGMRNARFRGAG